MVELLVVMVIIAILISLAHPTFDKMILKARSDEAKVTILSIAFAQERYYQEIGGFYPSVSNSEIKNEDTISKNLKIDLSISNNFIYTIQKDSDGNYIVKAIMRRDEAICSNGNSDDTFCKQSNSKDIDEWVGSYGEFNEDSRFIKFQYPTKLATSDFVEEGIDYEYLFQ